MKSRWDAGQFKLRGKKQMGLSCKCCVIENLVEEYENKQADREIREYKGDPVASEFQKTAECVTEVCLGR